MLQRFSGKRKVFLFCQRATLQDASFYMICIDFANGLQAKLSTTDTRKMKISEVSDYLNCQMILIENMLEGADYEEAANLDHMTENQFNV